MGKNYQKVVRNGFYVSYPGVCKYRYEWKYVRTRKGTGETTTDRNSSTSYYSNSSLQIGNVYTHDDEYGEDYFATFVSTYDRVYNYGAVLRITGAPDILVEPEAANVIVGSGELRVTLDTGWSEPNNPLRGGEMSSDLTGTDEENYNSARSSASKSLLSAGSNENNFVVHVNAEDVINHGFVMLPFYTDPILQNRPNGSYVVTPREAELITFIANPAARGEVSHLSPGQFSSLIKSQDNTISYQYDHNFGKYAQAFLSVSAENLDTGEEITILRKEAVSVSDGGIGSFTIPADTLETGRWKITIGAFPEASANYYENSDPFWTTGQTFLYVVRENPSSSSVDCDGKPIPLVSWLSVAQSAFQVRFGDYDSGARTGSGETFTVPKIFRDGAYPVQVRSAASAGDWSAWTETEYAEIQNVPPSGDFSAEAVQEGTNAVIRWTAFSGAAHYAVFRDGVMIAVTDASAVQYVDRIGAGGEYEVLAVTSERYYKSSGLLRFRLRLAADLISADGGYTWIACRLTPDRKSQPEDIRENMTFVYYAGSEKPAAFRSGQRERVKSFSYIFFSREPARRMRELLGREIIVKTTRGEHIRGTVADISWGDAKQPVVSFQVREVRGEEDGLEYPA